MLGENEVKWISVKDRLPKLSEYCYNYLVVIDGEVDTSPYSFNNDGTGQFVVTWMSDRIVTHWMPLPEPPRKE